MAVMPWQAAGIVRKLCRIGSTLQELLLTLDAGRMYTESAIEPSC
jgi:hypothetical protein